MKLTCRTIVILFTSLLALASGTATAADPEIAKAIKERQISFKKIGREMKGMKQTLGSGDMMAIAQSAETMATFAKKAVARFPEGSGPESGIKTEALATIWTDRKEFDGFANDLVSSTTAMAEAANSGNMSGVKQAFSGVRDACRGCHQKFRED